MRKCIIIDVEMLENRKLEKLLEKLTNKYGNAVAIYDEYNKMDAIVRILELTLYIDQDAVITYLKVNHDL